MHIAALVILVLPAWQASKKSRCCSRFYLFMKNYFFWSGPLRLFMQTYLDLFLAAQLNLITADPDAEVGAKKFSNIISWVALVASNVAILVLAVYTWTKFQAPEKSLTISSLLQGMHYGDPKKKPSKLLLVYPAVFFARRLIFVLSVFYIQSLWIKLVVHTAVSLCTAGYLLHAWPFISRFENKIEVMNECTLILLAYGLICFTEFVPEPEDRYKIGWGYIGINLANYGTHATIMTLASCLVLRLRIRKRFH